MIRVLLCVTITLSKGSRSDRATLVLALEQVSQLEKGSPVAQWPYLTTSTPVSRENGF